MNKLKKIIMNLSDDLKLTFQRFPVTALLIVLTAVTFSIFVVDPETNQAIFTEKIVPFLILWGFGTFFVETLFNTKDVRKWIGTALTALAAFGFVYWVNSQGKSVYGFSPLKTDANLSRFYYAYKLILLSLGVYVHLKRSEQPFAEYCNKVVQNLVQIGIVCGALAAGIAMVGATFVYLIMNGSDYTIVPKTEFIVIGIVAGIGFLSSLINTRKESAKFFVLVVRNVLLVLLIIAFGIIYLYIGKILITQIMPSNEVFRILALLFAIGLPIWTLAGWNDESSWQTRVARVLPYVFIPFIALQGYSIGLRIAENGLTPNRYLCVMLILFELVYIVVYYLRKRQAGMMLPFFVVFVLVAGVLPGVNMYSLSRADQYQALQRYLDTDFDSLTSVEQRRMIGAYYYLENQQEGKTMIADLDPALVDSIKANRYYGDLDSNQRYFFYQFPVSDLDIEPYRSLTFVSGLKGSDSPSLEEYELRTLDNQVLTTVDFSELASQFAAASRINNKAKLDSLQKIDMGDGSVLILQYLNLYLDLDENVEMLDLNGYWLKP